MDFRDFPIIDGAYQDDARPFSMQDTVNWLPTPAEQGGTRTPMKLESPAGLVDFCDLGTGKPIRGTHNAEGLLLAVSGNTLFRIAPTGLATAIGNIPGVGRVSMDHNKITGGNEVAIANGIGGYVYNTSTGTLAQITDEAFPGARLFGFIDGFMAFVDPSGSYWAHSEVRQATQYNSLDRYDAESAPDNLVTLIPSHREVFVLGQRTGEFFRNTGTAQRTFQRQDGAELEVGIASVFSCARLDNTVYWLGNDGIVYRLVGHSPQRVSTGPIEQAIRECNLANAFAYTWEQGGHKVFYLTFPDGHTWGFDVLSSRWHRRASLGLDRWRLNTMTAWNGMNIGGDFSNGKLYRVTSDVQTESGLPIVSRRVGGLIHAESNEVEIAAMRLLFDVGRGGPGDVDHHCSIRYSDDGGHNFTQARVTDIGRSGQYRIKVEEDQLGMALERVWDISVSGPRKRDLIGASIKAEAVAG